MSIMLHVGVTIKANEKEERQMRTRIYSSYQNEARERERERISRDDWTGLLTTDLLSLTYFVRFAFLFVGK